MLNDILYDYHCHLFNTQMQMFIREEYVENKLCCRKNRLRQLSYKYFFFWTVSLDYFMGLAECDEAILFLRVL